MGRHAKLTMDKKTLDKVKSLAGQGLTKDQIAKCLGISEPTLYANQNKYPEFLNAIKAGQAIGIEQVSNALFNRAMGCSTTEERFVMRDGEPEVVTATKHYPPDATSCIFYLKNRAPDQWKDRREVDQTIDDKRKHIDMTEEELKHRRAELLERRTHTTH